MVLAAFPRSRRSNVEVETHTEQVLDKSSGKVYLPPCQIACPIGEDIQRTNVMIARLPRSSEQLPAEVIKIGDYIYERNPLFPICGHICGLCEKECNYGKETGAIRRRLLKKFLSEYYLPYLQKEKAPLPLPSGERVAVVGGGPASLMCAYMLSKKGYAVSVFERSPRLGGVLNLIPRYRLPESVLDITLTALVRVAHIDVNFGANVGDSERTLAHFERDGYRAVFIGIGARSQRPLTFRNELVAGSTWARVMYGFQILSGVNIGGAYIGLFRDRKLIVIGGGNVAFDVARTARRLGGEVMIVCLECEDKSSRDGVPAGVEEIEGAREEGIQILFSRGVCEIVGESGRFRAVKCPRCISVWDENGRFNPKFDLNDVKYFEGDLLFLAIGQVVERAFLQQEGLLDERGRLDVDPLTLMSNRRRGIFLGGGMRQAGFAAEAMRDGMIAAESIDRYLKGGDLGVAEKREYVGAERPHLREYKPQPELKLRAAEERLDFEGVEIGFSVEEAVREAERCLRCGPCRSCKACVALALQPEIPEIEINENLCGRCGICLTVCSVSAIRLDTSEKGQVAVIEEWKCKRCGTCVAACPAGAIVLKDGVEEALTVA